MPLPMPVTRSITIGALQTAGGAPPTLASSSYYYTGYLGRVALYATLMSSSSVATHYAAWQQECVCLPHTAGHQRAGWCAS